MTSIFKAFIYIVFFISFVSYMNGNEHAVLFYNNLFNGFYEAFFVIKDAVMESDLRS